jgi:hypothetical protein
MHARLGGRLIARYRATTSEIETEISIFVLILPPDQLTSNNLVRTPKNTISL